MFFYCFCIKWSSLCWRPKNRETTFVPSALKNEKVFIVQYVSMKNTRNQCHGYVNMWAVHFYLLSLTRTHTHAHTNTQITDKSQIQTPVMQLDYNRAAVPLGCLLFICCQMWWYIQWKPIRNHLRLLQKHFYTRQTIPFFRWLMISGFWLVAAKNKSDRSQPQAYLHIL